MPVKTGVNYCVKRGGGGGEGEGKIIIVGWRKQLALKKKVQKV